MGQEMLINVRQPEECRIAVVEKGQLEELYVERSTNENFVGNIYKGVIVNIEPSIQAAFVDFGAGRNGFLHISDVEPHYFKQAPNFVDRSKDDERSNRRNRHDDDCFGYGRPKVKPLIQDVFHRGDDLCGVYALHIVLLQRDPLIRMIVLYGDADLGFAFQQLALFNEQHLAGNARMHR